MTRVFQSLYQNYYNNREIWIPPIALHFPTASIAQPQAGSVPGQTIPASSLATLLIPIRSLTGLTTSVCVQMSKTSALLSMTPPQTIRATPGCL